MAAMAGFVACVLPAYVVQALLMFSMPLVIEKRASPIDALSLSWNALKGQWLMATVFVFVLGMLVSAGSAVCGVGAFVTAPLALLSLVLLYRDFFPDEVSV
jgi:uncharacterized membrane protein